MKKAGNFFDFIGGDKAEKLIPKFTPPTAGDPRSIEMMLAVRALAVAEAETRALALHKKCMELAASKSVELAEMQKNLLDARKRVEETKNALKSFLAHDGRLDNDKPHLHKLVLNHFSKAATPKEGGAELPMTIFQIVITALLGLPMAAKERVRDFYDRMVRGNNLFQTVVNVAGESGYELDSSKPDSFLKQSFNLMAHLMRLMMEGSHMLATQEEGRARDRIAAGVARLQKLQMELRRVLPINDEGWDKLRLEILAEIEAEQKAQSEELATPREATPEVMQASGDDSPLSVLVTLKNKLGLDGTGYLRQVEEALRDGEVASAVKSLDEAITAYGEEMNAEAREQLCDFRKAIAE